MKVAAMKVGEAVCEALGLDPTRVRSIHLKFDLGDAVVETIERFATPEDVDGVCDVLRRYRIAELKGGGDEAQ